MIRKTGSRDSMFRDVKELQAKGIKLTTISKKLEIARRTARKYCGMEKLPPRNSKLRNECSLYDKCVEHELATERTMYSIFEELKHKGFKGTRTPFYDHYSCLSDGHGGYIPEGWKPDREEKSIYKCAALVPIKSLTELIDK